MSRGQEPLPKGTHVLLPGVTQPYMFGDMPDEGIVFRDGKFRRARKLVEHDGDDYSILPTIETTGDQPAYDHYTPEQHYGNLQHSVAFPPQLADVIAKLRRSADEMQSTFSKGMPEILGAGPDDGSEVRFECSTQKIASGTMFTVMHKMRAFFGKLAGGADVLRRTYTILAQADEDHAHHPIVKCVALGHFDPATNVACFLVLAQRAVAGAPMGAHTMPMHGVLYLNNVGGADAESLYNLSFSQVALDQTRVKVRTADGTEQYTKNLFTYDVHGACVMLGRAVGPAETCVMRPDVDMSIAATLQIGKMPGSKARVLFGRILFE